MEKLIDLKKKVPERTVEKPLLSWEIEEKMTREKSWQIGLIIFLIICFLFILWQKNYFGLVLIFVVAFLLFFPSRKKEKTYFAILKRGVQREREIFPWRNIKSFWISDNPPEIYLKSKKTYLPYHIIFPLPQEYIERARRLISKFIPEKETEKHLFDVLNKKLGL